VRTTDFDGESLPASSGATPERSLSPRSRGSAAEAGTGAGPADIAGLIAFAPHAIAITEGPSHLLRQVNPAFCRMMDVEAVDVLDRPYATAFPDPPDPNLPGLLTNVLTTGEAQQNREVTQPGPGAEPPVWSYAVWPLRDRAGSAAGLVVEIQDRTDDSRSIGRLKGLTDDIRQINERLLSSAIREQEWAEKAEGAAKAKSDFLAMMSHELRTPLNAIVSYTEILLTGIAGPTTDRQRECLQRVRSSSDHLLTLIGEVLTFAKVEARGLLPRTNRVDLGRLAREAAALIEPLAAKKGLELHLDVTDTLLETDANKVHQILVNLLGNAVKFTDEGEVRLEVSDDPEDQEKVRVRVRDTGIGIPAQDLERNFEPFVQSESVLTRRFGGTGLGLTISRALATLLGGALTAESTPGKGATFTLRLPHSTTPLQALQ
jgi:signal transduction histidine kinase